jgi:hypothetical protein
LFKLIFSLNGAVVKCVDLMAKLQQSQRNGIIYGVGAHVRHLLAVTCPGVDLQAPPTTRKKKSNKIFWRNSPAVGLIRYVSKNNWPIGASANR